MLIRAGELADEFFVLISGSAERGLPGEPIRKVGPGDYLAFLAHRLREADLRQDHETA